MSEVEKLDRAIKAVKMIVTNLQQKEKHFTVNISLSQFNGTLQYTYEKEVAVLGNSTAVYNISFQPSVMDDNYLLNILVSDNETITTLLQTIVSVDSTPPWITFSTTGNIGENGWFIGPVELIFNAIDKIHDVTSG